MIIYYPVSALVTLFANILQNPQDARARSDIKLMNLVVNFLSLLVSDESNGSVKRMLGVCAEFERIAKVVLDKAEKESHSRRKRRIVPEDKNTQSQPGNTEGNSSAESPSANQSDAQQSTTLPFSPQTQPGDANENSFNAAGNGVTSNLESTNPATSDSSAQPNNNVPNMPEFGQDFQDMLSPDGLDQSAFTNQESYPNSSAAAMNMSSFQQPFVPQDLWQMPMTLEWDWADMTSSGFPLFENGDQPGGPPHSGP